MLWFMVAAALAAPPDPENQVLELVTETQYMVQRYDFDIDSCDGVRAQATTSADDGFNTRVVLLRINNKSSETCSYHGLVLKGFLEGKYQSVPATSSMTGVHIDPGMSFMFEVTTAVAEPVRNRVKLEIAPGRGIMVFRGYRGEAE